MNAIKFFSMLCAGASLSLCSTHLTAADAPKTGTAEAARSPALATSDGGWTRLFDGKTLTGWKEADFPSRGPVVVTNNEIVLKTGYMTGITWTNTKSMLRTDYELALEARRLEGNDFFCGLTFPVSTNACSLVVGGWGGSLVGISSLDGNDAANNETSKSMEFKEKQWYRIRVQVRPNRLKAWIDEDKMVDVDISERRLSVRMEMESCVPLGVATWSTSGGLRNIRVRPLTDADK